MAKLTPYLFSENTRAQAEFYIDALGGEILSILTYTPQEPDTKEALRDRVLYLSLVAGGMNIVMSDSVFEPVSRGNAINLLVEFETEAEAREAFDKLAEGGKVKDPLKPAYWGTLFGQVEDQYGVIWRIGHTVKVG